MLKKENIKTKPKYGGIFGWDIETYRDEIFNSVTYALCLYGELYNGKKIKYIEKEFYGLNCVKEFCDYIEKISTPVNNEKTRPHNKIPNIYVYSFNGSRFDNLFIYDCLHDKDPSTKYCFTGNSIKYIKYNNISFYDISLFYKLGSLRKTCKAFNLTEEKGTFPYDFVNKDNLNYCGVIPDRKYWNSDKDYNSYINKYDNQFHMKDYTLKYCMKDSRLVFQLARYHINNCSGEINGRKYNVINSPTSANMSIKMFTQCFLKETLFQSPDNIVDYEKLSYKGGRTEVFKKHFKGDSKLRTSRLYYVDINSSYPAGMTEMMPYKYQQTCERPETLMKIGEIVDYHLYYIRSDYVGNNPFFIPNLLMRSKNGNIIACKNTCYGWHWGNELKEAILNDCNIYNKIVIKYEGKKIFKEFAEYFYDERLKAKKTNLALSLFLKTTMNSLYGKFGQRQFNKSAIVNDNVGLSNILKNDMTKLLSFECINNKLFIEYKEEGSEYNSIGKLMRFSSYIASTSRVKLSQIMRDVGHENVYYCDTDSVFTSKIPSDKFLDNSKLGLWKQETNKPIIEAYFLAPKVYYYICEDGYTGKACKGINKKSLTKDDYVDLHTGKKESISQNRKMFFRTLENVKIMDQERNLHVVYNKRLWVDNNSKPFDDIIEWSKFNK